MAGFECDAVGVRPETESHLPKHPQFADVGKRKQSFEGKWPHKSPNCDKVAIAGFFYNHNGNLAHLLIMF